MLSFGLVVATNNLVALKNFNVFLNNYQIFDKPLFLERWMLRRLHLWVQNKAIKNFNDIVEEVRKTEINVGLKDCATSMFTTLYIANEYQYGRMEIHNALELFQLMGNTELEFEKLKNPKVDESYK